MCENTVSRSNKNKTVLYSEILGKDKKFTYVQQVNWWCENKYNTYVLLEIECVC